MEFREEIVRSYFKAWINNERDVLKEIFSENIVYSECYGPEYNGIDIIQRWFEDWHNNGEVLAWDIKQFIHDGNITVVEWYFKCVYKDNASEFDGVSIIDFDDNNRIISLKEFQSKFKHYYPYG
ncbi:nuclear transport factor 2 family protein [Clostridium sp.]|uniref:nuclear transport factor 2 family protein n=1 Tax=Clostridium sp. TaxID=1506 RepID=UPI001DB8130D|nr:nuclear transport factor 2 family protein [Clostridium sp.]MBS5938304.1 nuclear transport factor 2 family protein [Clostridium sp.]